jgi:hypothetical protein
MDRLKAVKGVGRTQTLIALSSSKETHILSAPQTGDDAGSASKSNRHA